MERLQAAVGVEGADGAEADNGKAEAEAEAEQEQEEKGEMGSPGRRSAYSAASAGAAAAEERARVVTGVTATAAVVREVLRPGGVMPSPCALDSLLLFAA